MRETWYVLEDGTPANPNEVAPDDKGRIAATRAAPLSRLGRSWAEVDGGLTWTKRASAGARLRRRPWMRRLRLSRPRLRPRMHPAPQDREMKSGHPKKYKTR